MFNICLNFEHQAGSFSSIVLIAPGLIAVIAGLFVWIGGIGFRRTLIAIVGAVAGAVLGLFISGRNPLLIITSAFIAAFAAVVLEKIIITVITALLAAILAFTVLTALNVESYPNAPQNPQYQNTGDNVTLSTKQSIEMINAFAMDFTNQVKNDSRKLPPYAWIIIAASALMFVFVAFYFWRLASALCCATLGTIIIFAGMILLLLYKGAAPITHIFNNNAFYGIVFAAMTAFGAIAQLALCKIPEKQAPKTSHSKDNKSEPGKKTVSWRTH